MRQVQVDNVIGFEMDPLEDLIAATMDLAYVDALDYEEVEELRNDNDEI